MSELELVRELAKEALTAPGELGAFLWGRAERLVRNAEYICQLPELAQAGLRVDRFCLAAAAYFSEGGLARYLESKGGRAKFGLNDVNGDDLLEFSGQVAEQRLCVAEEFMDELKVEAEGRDLEGLAVRSVEKKISS